MNVKFWKDAVIRAIRTFCQGLVTLIGTNAVNIVELDWPRMLGIAATMALVSLLTSIATGLPETEVISIEDDINGMDEFEAERGEE